MPGVRTYTLLVSLHFTGNNSAVLKSTEVQTLAIINECVELQLDLARQNRYLSDYCCFGLDLPDVCIAVANKAVVTTRSGGIGIGAAAAIAARPLFNSTADVCAHVAEVSSLWESASAGGATGGGGGGGGGAMHSRTASSGAAASSIGGFFDALPEPSSPPHLYEGANAVVQSYRAFMNKIVH
jgi:hypothetical protein